MDYADAAALPVAYGTALRMMVTNGGVAAGDKVLILGASGGVGVCCVQLAKARRREVVACAGSDEKAGAVARPRRRPRHRLRDSRLHGGNVGVVRQAARRGATGGVDVVVNYTGGDTWVKSMRVLKVGGKLLTCGATAGYDPTEDMRFIWTFELKVLGSNGWTRDDIHTLLGMVQDGRLKVLMDHIYALDDAPAALAAIEHRQVFGKVVVGAMTEPAACRRGDCSGGRRSSPSSRSSA